MQVSQSVSQVSVRRPAQERAKASPSFESLQREEAASYVADMLLELHKLASMHDLESVSVPIQYAYYAAFSASQKPQIAESSEADEEMEFGR